MAVLGLHSIALEVPDLSVGETFYTDAGLLSSGSADRLSLSCAGQDHPALTLIRTTGAKRLHHVCLRADRLDEMPAAIAAHGGKIVGAPAGHDRSGLWVTDPHGTLFHLVDVPPHPELAPVAPFTVNGPGHIVRIRRSAVRPQFAYPAVKPLRLGHCILFSPDVTASVEFVVKGFGMGLADHVDDIIAFCCARQHSDHHVVAFAKSPGIGFHHASFQVSDPDEVGRGGRALAEKAGRGHWGFGRHTIGSNFFHYIQDPWGSWIEYYSDMDYIDDYAAWTPTNYGKEDALACWAPACPADFTHNYEISGEAVDGARRQAAGGP